MNIISNIRRQLRQNSSKKTKVSAQRFFKEKIRLYGVKTAFVKRIGKEGFNVIKEKNKSDIIALCEILWASGYMEESFIACNWSYAIRKRYEPKDFKVFEKWMNKYVSNWASCDTLSNNTIGAFIEMYPEYLSALKKWTKSTNRWKRRSAAVSLIVPARHGEFLNDIFEIADMLLTDDDDLVQKGYGWMLKAASNKHLKEVFYYVMAKRDVMPRTALRYAIEKMPDDLKKKAMCKP